MAFVHNVIMKMKEGQKLSLKSNQSSSNGLSSKTRCMCEAPDPILFPRGRLRGTKANK